MSLRREHDSNSDDIVSHLNDLARVQPPSESLVVQEWAERAAVTCSICAALPARHPDRFDLGLCSLTLPQRCCQSWYLSRPMPNDRATFAAGHAD